MFGEELRFHVMQSAGEADSHLVSRFWYRGMSENSCQVLKKITRRFIQEIRDGLPSFSAGAGFVTGKGQEETFLESQSTSSAEPLPPSWTAFENSR